MPSYPFQTYGSKEARFFHQNFLNEYFQETKNWENFYHNQVAFAFPLVFTLSTCLSGSIASYSGGGGDDVLASVSP